MFAVAVEPVIAVVRVSMMMPDEIPIPPTGEKNDDIADGDVSDPVKPALIRFMKR